MWFGCSSLMAIFAMGWRWFVEEHHRAIHLLPQHVTGRAGHIFMSALQCEQSCVVVEERGTPLVRVVTRRAIAASGAELIRMWVFVTIAAIDGRFREVNMHHRALQIGRTVALGARHSAMRTHQRKARVRMIEPRHIAPCLGGVTRLAAEDATARAVPSHTLRELAPVYVLVAGCAAQIREVIERYLCTGSRLVAFVTRHCCMTSSERKWALLVHGQREGGCLERGFVVALLAAVVPRRAGKLPFVLILVAVHASRKCQLEAGLLASRDMA